MMKVASLANLIDIHTHLLPSWDDGADSWATSLAMLRQAEEDGIAEVVCTPHILCKQDFQQEQKLTARFMELCQRANAIGIRTNLHLGAEIFIHPDLDLHYPIATLGANGRYFLVEFPMSMTPETVIRSFLDEIFKEKIPVIAHPERYLRIINNPAEAFLYVQRGALLQINAGSILGNFGQMVKEVAHQLIDANLAHLVASDAHDTKARPLRLKSAFVYVAEKWGRDKAEQLFIENPRRLLKGELIKSEPKPLQKKKKSAWRKYLQSFAKKMGT